MTAHRAAAGRCSPAGLSVDRALLSGRWSAPRNRLCPGNGLAVGDGSGPGGKRRFRLAIGLAKQSSRPCLGWRLPHPSAGASHGGSCTWRGMRSEYQPGNQGTSRPCPCPGSRRAGHRHWSPGARRERGMTDRKSCRACAPHDATRILSVTYVPLLPLYRVKGKIRALRGRKMKWECASQDPRVVAHGC